MVVLSMEAAPSSSSNAKGIEEDGSAVPLAEQVAVVLQDVIRASNEKDATIAKLREELDGLRAIAASRTSRGVEPDVPDVQSWQSRWRWRPGGWQHDTGQWAGGRWFSRQPWDPPRRAETAEGELAAAGSFSRLGAHAALGSPRRAETSFCCKRSVSASSSHGPPPLQGANARAASPPRCKRNLGIPRSVA